MRRRLRFDGLAVRQWALEEMPRMDRRSFLKTTSAVAAATTGVAAPALAADHTGGDSGVRSDLPAPAIGSDVRHLVIVSAWPETVAGYWSRGGG